MRLVLINKRMYAVGLQWLSTTGKLKKRTLSELLTDAQSLDPQLDLVAFRPSQHGFGCSDGNAVRWLKTCPLVTMLRVPSNFIGMFLLEDSAGERFWWVHASRKNLVTAQGDNLFSTREEAWNHVLGVQDLLGEFEQITSCEELSESEAWLSARLKPGFCPMLFGHGLRQLHPIRQRRKLVALLVTVGVVVAGGYGVQAFLEHRAGQQAMEMARLAMLDKEKHRKTLLAQAEKYFPKPWAGAGVLTVRDMVSACLPPMLDLPSAANGWTPDSAVCNGRTVKTTWLHHPGADYLHLPQGGRLLTPQKAESSQQLRPFFARRNSATPLSGREELSSRLYQLTQTLGLKLKLSFEPPAKRVVDTVELVAPWVRGTFELSGLPSAFVLQPEPVADLLSLPGLVLEEVRFSRGNIWSFKGSVYANVK